MRVLITGMSATGKSSVIGELAARGCHAVDLDSPEWSEWVPFDGNPTGANPGHDWVWREDRFEELLAAPLPPAKALFVSGCAPNMGKFLSRFDHVVLLTAPVGIMLERLARRSGNPYGKRPREADQVLENRQVIEPKLRVIATCEIDTSVSLGEVVDAVLRLVAKRAPATT